MKLLKLLTSTIHFFFVFLTKFLINLNGMIGISHLKHTRKQSKSHLN